MAGDEIIQQFVTELKKNPSAHQFVKSVFGQLKAATNDADGLTAAEVTKISTSAKKQLNDAKNDGIISAEEEKIGSQMIASMQNLPQLDKANTQKFLNGFDALLDAQTKEEAKKAATQANEAAPDFFKMIIGFLMQLLGFPPEQVQEFLGQTENTAPTKQAPTTTAPKANTASADPTLIGDVGRAVGPMPNTPEARAMVQTADYVARNAQHRTDLLAANPKMSMQQIVAKTGEGSGDTSKSRESYYAAAFKENAYAMANGSWSPTGVAVPAVGAAAFTASYLGGGAALSLTGIGAPVGVPLILAGAGIAVAGAAITGVSATTAYNAVDGVPMINYNGIQGDLRRATEEAARRKREVAADPLNEYLGLEVSLTTAKINDVNAMVVTAAPLKRNSPMERDARAIGEKEAEQQLLASMRTGYMPQYDLEALNQQKSALNIDKQKKALEEIATQKEAILLQIGRNTALSQLNEEISLHPEKARSTAGWWKAKTMNMFTETDAHTGYIASEASKNKIAADDAINDLRKKLAALEEKQTSAAKDLAAGFKEEAKLNQQMEYSKGFVNGTGLAGEVSKIHGQLFAKERQAEIDRQKLDDEAKKQKIIDDANAKLKVKQDALRAEASGLGKGSSAAQGGAYYTGAAQQQDQRASIENQLAQKKASLQEAQRELHELEGAVRAARGEASVKDKARQIPGARSGAHFDASTSSNTNSSYSGNSWSNSTIQADMHFPKDLGADYQSKVMREKAKQDFHSASRDANYLDRDTQLRREELTHKIHVLKEDIRFLDGQLLGAGGGYDRLSLKTRERVAELAEALQMPESVILKSEKLMRQVGKLEREEKLAGMYGNITSQPIKETMVGYGMPDIDPLKASGVNHANIDYNRQIALGAAQDVNDGRRAARGKVEAAAAKNADRVHALTGNIGEIAQVEYVKELRVNLRQIQENLVEVASTRDRLVQITDDIAKRITQTLRSDPQDVSGLIRQGKELEKQASTLQAMGSQDAANSLLAASGLIKNAIMNPNALDEDQVNHSEKLQIAQAVRGLKNAVEHSLDKTTENLEKKKDKTIESIENLRPSDGGKKPTTPGGPRSFA
jgi:hypothetical protein